MWKLHGKYGGPKKLIWDQAQVFQCSPPGHHVTFGARKERVQIQHILDVGSGLQDRTKL
jgi:hypothetical protein